MNLIENATHIRDLQGLPDDTKIQFLICRLATVDVKQGKRGTYYNVRLEDPEDRSVCVYGNVFTNYSPGPQAGNVVVVEGASKGTFNNRPTITVNKQGTFTPYKRDAAQTAPQRSGTQSGQPHHPAPKPAPTASGTPASPIHGATVGGALARAVDLYMHVRPQGTGQMLEQQDWEDIEDITRRLVVIQQRIESGESVPF